MKRRLLLGATLILTILAMTIPTTALAANSTCTTHDIAIASWSIQTDTVNSPWDFKCGGANNEPYQVDFRLQWFRASDSTWFTFDCANGLACLAGKPSLTSYYAGGTEHSGTNTFTVAGNIDCLDIRNHVTVQFEFGSPSLNFNSQTVHVGC